MANNSSAAILTSHVSPIKYFFPVTKEFPFLAPGRSHIALFVNADRPVALS